MAIQEEICSEKSTEPNLKWNCVKMGGLVNLANGPLGRGVNPQLMDINFVGVR